MVWVWEIPHWGGTGGLALLARCGRASLVPHRVSVEELALMVWARVNWFSPHLGSVGEKALKL